MTLQPMSLRSLTDIAEHSTQSSRLEKVLEHLFVGDLLRRLWLREVRDVELLRTEVDCAGYDLAIERNGVFRHILLKASHANAKTREVKVNRAIWEKAH